MKSYLFLVAIAVIMLSCDSSTGGGGDDRFSGITKTDYTCNILELDSNDWKPWQLVGKGLAVVDTVVIGKIDTNFVAKICPNPSHDIFNIEFENYADNYKYKIDIYDKPGHLFKTIYETDYLKAGKWNFQCNAYDFGLTEGIYRIYLTRTGTNGVKYQTYGDLQIIE